MSKFFAVSSTPSELVEKSLQTQIAMVEAYVNTLNFFKKIAAKEAEQFKQDFGKESQICDDFDKIIELQIDMGRMLIGGDDIFLILPGYLSIPFALKLGEEFYRMMGGSKTGMNLSAGVLSTTPKSPFRNSLQNADELLVNAKIKSRNQPDPIQMFIDFDYLFQSISARDLAANREEFREVGGISRPFAINPSVEQASCFEIILSSLCPGEIGLERLVAKCYKYYLLTCLEKNSSKAKERLKKHRWKIFQRLSLEVLSRLDLGSSSFQNRVKRGIVYCVYQKARIMKNKQEEDKETQKIKEKTFVSMIRLLWPFFTDKRKEDGDSILLLDAYIINKMLTGGR